MKSGALKFIDGNNILFDWQHGFRSGCSTADAVLQYVADCTQQIFNHFHIFRFQQSVRYGEQVNYIA